MARPIGFVYCMTNFYMPGICKIGMTDRAPSQRRAELSASTSVPWDFDIMFYVEVEDAFSVERAAHAAFADVRVNDGREFFKCSPAQVYQWILSNSDIITDFVDGALLYQLKYPENSTSEVD